MPKLSRLTYIKPPQGLWEPPGYCCDLALLGLSNRHGDSEITIMGARFFRCDREYPLYFLWYVSGDPLYRLAIQLDDPLV
jgi:hypothetical protein